MAWKTEKLGKLLTESKIPSEAPCTTKRIRVRLNVAGVEKRPESNDKKGATAYYVRRAGQFIYGKQNFHKGAFGIIPPELDGFESSADIPSFDVRKDCLPEWIFYFFKKGNRYLNLTKLARGVGSKRVHPKQLKNIEILLPPVDVQQMIIDEAHQKETTFKDLTTEIEKQKKLLAKYRQAILQEAIEGKLTEDWREQKTLPAPQPGNFFVYVLKCSDGSHYIGHTDNLPRRWEEHKAGIGSDWTKKHPPQYVAYWEEFTNRKEAADKEKWLKTGFGRKWIKREEKAGRLRQAGAIEPAAELLKRIDAEKASREGAKTRRKQKPLPPIKPEEIPFDIPESWHWCRLGEYALFERGRFSVRPRNDPSCFGGDYPFIQIGSLDSSGSIVSNYATTLNEKGLAASKMFPKGTIMIAIVGGTIGNLGVLGIDMCFPDSMVGVKPSASTCQDYILTLLRYNQPMIQALAYQMAGQPNIKLPTLSELPCALPPLAEQQEIVRRVESKFALCDQLEAQINASAHTAETLSAAILQELFDQNGGED